MKPGRAHAADVHARPFTNGLETFENGDVFRGVVRRCHAYNVRLVKRRLAALLCLTIVAAFPFRAAAAATVYEDVPVPGGSAALASALGIDAAPERARFVFEITRLVYDNPEGRRSAADAFLQRLRQEQSRGRRAVLQGASDLVPVPLTADVWSDAIFHRRVAKDELVYAIVADRSAALVCHGLASLDDETLQYLTDHSSILTRIYERSAPVFGAFASSLHVHASRIVPLGGEAAVALWETAVAERLTRPDRFLPLLLETNDGRLAGLYDAIGQMDAPHRRFVLGDWLPTAAQRAERFKLLSTFGVTALKEWHVRTLPFGRVSFDLQTALTRIAVDERGAPVRPNARGFWTRVFAGVDVSEDAARQLQAIDEEPIDAAWIADAIETVDIRQRGDRLDQIALAQRVFGDTGAGPERADVFLAIRGMTRFRMLIVTLDRMGITAPSTYSSALRHAVRLGAIASHHGFVAQAQFQGALALLARMRAVRTLDLTRAQTLVERLAVLPLVDGRYNGAVASWIRADLATAIPPAETMELAVLSAMSGAASAEP